MVNRYGMQLRQVGRLIFLSGCLLPLNPHPNLDSKLTIKPETDSKKVIWDQYFTKRCLLRDISVHRGPRSTVEKQANC
jgi:hypothetical protein